MPPPQKVPPVGRGGSSFKEPPPKSAGKRGKRICGGEEEFCLLLGLPLGHGDRELLQLLIIHKVGAAGHRHPLVPWPRGTPLELHIPGGSEFRLRQGFAPMRRQNAWTPLSAARLAHDQLYSSVSFLVTAMDSSSSCLSSTKSGQLVMGIPLALWPRGTPLGLHLPGGSEFRRGKVLPP